MSKETQNNEEIVNNQFAEWETPGTETFFEDTSVTPAEKIVEEAIKDKGVKTEVIENAEEDDDTTPSDKPEGYVFKFGDEDEETGEEDEDEIIPGKTKETSTKVDSKSTLQFLKEKGLVNYELEEGEELTSDIADEILEDTWEASIDAGVAETIKDLPDPIKELIKFVNKGGDYTQMLSSLAKQSVSGINKDTDMEVESNQITVLTQERQLQGYDKDDIAGEIEYLKDSGKLKAAADKLFPKVIERQAKEITSRAAAQAEAKADAKEKQRIYKSEIATQLGSVEDIKGIVLNKQDKEGLPAYISDANVKLQDGRVVTKFQQELFSVFGDKEKTILLAKLIKSDFDFSSISNKAISKEARHIKNEMQNNKIDIKGSKGSSQKQSKKSLADLLD